MRCWHGTLAAMNRELFSAFARQKNGAEKWLLSDRFLLLSAPVFGFVPIHLQHQ